MSTGRHLPHPLVCPRNALSMVNGMKNQGVSTPLGAPNGPGVETEGPLVGLHNMIKQHNVAILNILHINHLKIWNICKVSVLFICKVSVSFSALSAKFPYCLLLYMQSVLIIYCFIICKVSLLFTALYAKCPYDSLLYMQSVRIII